MKLLSTENHQNHDGRPANRCDECGGIDFYQCVSAGVGRNDELLCVDCGLVAGEIPNDSPRYQATAINGRLRWRRVDAVDTGSEAPISHREDPQSPTKLVYASPLLSWFYVALESNFARDVTLWRSAGLRDGVYRRLDQAYFGWLVQRQRDAYPTANYPPEFFEITAAAQIAGVFGDWSRDVERWPTVPPRGYIGPQELDVRLSFGDGWLRETENRERSHARAYDGGRAWQAELDRWTAGVR